MQYYVATKHALDHWHARCGRPVGPPGPLIACALAARPADDSEAACARQFFGGGSPDAYYLANDDHEVLLVCHPDDKRPNLGVIRSVATFDVVADRLWDILRIRRRRALKRRKKHLKRSKKYRDRIPDRSRHLGGNGRSHTRAWEDDGGL